MGRAEQRLYTVGRFWLALRPDGRSPFYQIRWYDEATKTTRGKSTGCRELAGAKAAILAHVQDDLTAGPQRSEDAAVVPLLLRYYSDRGHSRRNAGAVDSSLRIFTAFLDQDRAGIDVTVAGLKPDVFQRFIAWRSGPHAWDIHWRGKQYAHASPGVSGEATQRNLDDVRAALNHAASMGRIPFAPKVRSVDSDMRSPARSAKLTIDQLGSIVGYAAYDLEALRWVLAMIATGARPDATLQWSVAAQWEERGSNFDTHPKGWPITKKRNAIVPVIPEFRPWLMAWAGYPHKPVKSRKTWWRHMRAQLGLPADIVPKTIRHSVATELRSRGVPMDEIAGLLGHTGDRRITQGYAKYDPSRLPHAKLELSAIWNEVCASANKWLTDHIRSSGLRGVPISVVRKAKKC